MLQSVSSKQKEIKPATNGKHQALTRRELGQEDGTASPGDRLAVFPRLNLLRPLAQRVLPRVVSETQGRSQQPCLRHSLTARASNKRVDE